MKQNRTIAQLAKTAKLQSLKLAKLTLEQRNDILYQIQKEITNNFDSIEHANQIDCNLAQTSVSVGKMSQALYKRLHMSKEKIESLHDYLKQIILLEDPIRKKQYEMEIADGMKLTRYSSPIGVLAVIFESRPEVVLQVSALALKSGNGAILKGGVEASNSNKAIFSCVDTVLKKNNLSGVIQQIKTRKEVQEILQEETWIDLIIPRGSNEFVRYIQENSSIPVLGHSSGVCHLYVAKEADPNTAIELAMDSKLDYPSACNALETLLIHKSHVQILLPTLLKQFQSKGVSFYGCPDSIQIAHDCNIPMEPVLNWSKEYSDLFLSIKIISNIQSAIDHINEYGSHHTDSIVTENQKEAEQFFASVDSGCVFHNTSTRFSDGYIFGLGAEVGISTNKIHARGPVGLEGLMTYKYQLTGNGDKKSDFSGEHPRVFTHKNLLSN